MSEKLLNPDGSGKFLEPEDKMADVAFHGQNEERIEELKRKQQGGVAEATPPICPFMSSPDQEVSCTPRCKLYRKARQGYECYLMEMQSISWNTRGRGGQPPPPQY